MRYFNAISVVIGIAVTGFFCLIWKLFSPPDPMSLYSGIAGIIGLVFFAGLKKVPAVHQEILQVFGRRTGIRFGEGWRWVPIIFGSTKEESAQEKVFDVPIISCLAKDKVEMELDVFIQWRIGDPSNFQRLKDGEKDITTFLQSKATEAGMEFIQANSSNSCLGCEADVANRIQERITREIGRLGIEIMGVDVRSLLPAKIIRDELAISKNKKLKTQAFAQNLKKIRKALGEDKVSGDALINATQVTEGDAKKTIEEKKQTFKLDVETGILNLASDLLSKVLSGEKKDE